MQGPKKTPTIEDLKTAYNSLQFNPKSISISKLVLWSEWVRLDPRLGEIIIEHLAKFWKEKNPVEINENLQHQVWPAAFGVLLEQVPFYYEQKQRGKKWNKKLFEIWAKCAMTNVAKAKDELFFIDLYKPGGKLMRKECLYSINIYKKWGYLGRDILINKAEKFKKTLMPPLQRKRIIDEILKTKDKITVEDYLREINFQIHLRQAQRDLKNHPQLKAMGNTKGRYYIKNI